MVDILGLRFIDVEVESLSKVFLCFYDLLEILLRRRGNSYVASKRSQVVLGYFLLEDGF